MKILVYGMQSSGASLFTLFLLQNRDYIGIIDLYCGCLAPKIDEPNFALKCVVTADFTLEQHKAEYKPDYTILVLRNPVQNMVSLVSKQYANQNGTLEQKFKRLDGYLANPDKHFDYIAKYDDFILGNLGSTPSFCNENYYRFDRSIGEVVTATCMKNEWCHAKYLKSWSAGNIHWDKLNFMRMKGICPNSFEYFKRG